MFKRLWRWIRGFTALEWVMVLCIIGILLASVIPAIQILNRTPGPPAVMALPESEEE